MDLKLQRTACTAEGIFSTLTNDDNDSLFVGEHAYPLVGTNDWVPKLPAGVYACKRGEHQLQGMQTTFQTFEVTGVEGHQGILFHSGNDPQIDSAGCLLLGNAQMGHLIVNSRIGFQTFMQWETGCDEFSLTVLDVS